MRENCPNCGTTLATRDAVCPECRCPLDDPGFSWVPEKTGGERGPARQMSEVFTVAGRLLLIATIILAAGGTYGVVVLFVEKLPPGSYPLLLFGAPGLLASGLFFVTVAVILTRLGIKIFQDRK